MVAIEVAYCSLSPYIPHLHRGSACDKDIEASFVCTMCCWRITSLLATNTPYTHCTSPLPCCNCTSPHPPYTQPSTLTTAAAWLPLWPVTIYLPPSIQSQHDCMEEEEGRGYMLDAYRHHCALTSQRYGIASGSFKALHT